MALFHSFPLAFTMSNDDADAIPCKGFFINGVVRKGVPGHMANDGYYDEAEQSGGHSRDLCLRSVPLCFRPMKAEVLIMIIMLAGTGHGVVIHDLLSSLAQP